MVSFIGCVPADNPEMVIFVVIDEPQNVAVQSSSVATELAGKILKDVLPFLEIYPSESSKDLDMNAVTPLLPSSDTQNNPDKDIAKDSDKAGEKENTKENSDTAKESSATEEGSKTETNSDTENSSETSRDASSEESTNGDGKENTKSDYTPGEGEEPVQDEIPDNLNETTESQDTE
ncbi:MAG: hypothetical protein ACFWTJ_03780 [Lachnoclostridium sp.]